MHSPAADKHSADDGSTSIVLANDLRSGLTLFLTSSGDWSQHASKAWLVRGEADTQSALKIATEAESNNEVIDAYLTRSNYLGEPVSMRERLRLRGPSVEYSPDRPPMAQNTPPELS